MSTVVAKWGNSLAIRIPKAWAEQVQLKEGTDVNLSVSGDSLVITPKKRKKYSLDELLAGMTPDKFHPEIDTGNSMGNEVW
ncbi:AbrB/MazE/SpoVT family DNA-binding domain-containing protein [Trichormus variabilis]|uniref:Multidrug transporter MatE n=1 Tax=Trichormus variabilis SAG 1403-4b TaxID=447716 RepID=A0A433USI2_ANAVA|nr:AbrB/MazE/SpoVT family DNA-binding domain-containing protein [Trichormus variabilis]MBD2628090.1 AbrB/MazE/SpoVT family DNA-binding domain-containing protein [Trichormus variabilis FACHB-164]RUS96812.1 multidrug transporter MatE [Trichormus variabilis SAG 1403-4b]